MYTNIYIMHILIILADLNKPFLFFMFAHSIRPEHTNITKQTQTVCVRVAWVGGGWWWWYVCGSSVITAIVLLSFLQ